MTDAERALREVVSALVTSGARLTGSWARGEETPLSDLDFWVPQRSWRRFVWEAPPGWESVAPGHVGWRLPLHVGLPDVQIDVSTLFRAQRRRLPEREVRVLWKTR